MELTKFVSDSLSAAIVLAFTACVFFLIKGGYQFIASTGDPEVLASAKKTIKNTLIGLVLVLAASSFASLLNYSFTTPASPEFAEVLNIAPIEPEPANGITQVLLEAISSFLQNIVLSAAKPISDGIISFLTQTPALSTNSVVFNFWLKMVGIVDGIFVLVIVLLGFQFMSASSLGFEELELKKILPKIGLSFLLANTSIFIIDWVIALSNTLVSTVLAGSGLAEAWAAVAFSPRTLQYFSASIPLITLIFGLIFVVVASILLLSLITRLIVLAVGAVLSPYIFLLWAIPKFSDFADISVRSYLAIIFSVFVHVVIIQLASAFLTIPGQVNANPLVSVLLGVGLVITLLKVQSAMVQMMFYNTTGAVFKKIGGQIVNVISSGKTATIGKAANATKKYI